MKLHTNPSFVNPPNALVRPELTRRHDDHARQISFFHELAADSKVNAQAAHLVKMLDSGQSGVLASIKPRELMDPKLFTSTSKAPPFQPGTVWPTKEYDGMYSSMSTDAASVSHMATRFEHLGWKSSLFMEYINTVAFSEKPLFDEKINPRPKKFLKKMPLDDWNAHVAQNVYDIRDNATLIINKKNDETGIPVHLSFAWDGNRAEPFKQKLVFYFPESNEELQIWRHVFNGQPIERVRDSSESNLHVAEKELSRNQLPSYRSPEVWQSNG